MTRQTHITVARSLAEVKLVTAWMKVAQQAMENADQIGQYGFNPSHALSDFVRHGTDTIREATEILTATTTGDWRGIT